MASIELYFSGETIPVYDVDLESVTALELVEAAKEAGVLPPVGINYDYIDWLLVGKNGYPIDFVFQDEREKTLSELGFSDGDSIKVIGKPKAFV